MTLRSALRFAMIVAAALSAAPFLPFDRYLDTRETVVWPDVSSTTEPDEHAVRPRSYSKLPAGHAVYYQLANNYGALGIVALDPDLEFTGIGSRKFVARKASGTAEIGITFPKWDGFKTLLEARRENRVMRQPLLARADAAREEALPANIRVNASFPFPSLVSGTGPVTISKANGVWSIGFSMAVLTSTASAPSSIASAAWLGAPKPASTTTGTVACSMMIRIWSRVCTPRFEPMGEPSGITVAQPASCNRFARTGSALM